MSKVFPFRLFWKLRAVRFRTSTQATIVQSLLFFLLITPPATALLELPSVFNFTSQAFAQSSGKQTNSQLRHQLENYLISIEGRDDWTRLMLAILKSVTAVERVLAQGVSVNIRGTEEFHGVTPLMFASGIGVQEIVKILVVKGARLNDTDTQGNSALSKAAHKGHLDTVRFLLQQGANPNAETNQKWTALMFASHRGQIDVLKTLLKHGARADLQNELGMSSVMYAAQNGHLEIVHILIQRGAKVDLTSLNGSTALIWAIRSGQEKIAEVLLESGAKTDSLEKEFRRSP